MSGPSSDDFLDPVHRLPIEDILDLHSISAKDVEAVVREYLREAHAAGFRYVRIIHGRGIGVRRDIVRRIAAATPSVISYQDGPLEAGGWGATLLELDVQRPFEES